MDIKTLVLAAFQVSLLLTVFGFGLRATLDDVLYLVHRPWLFARSLVAMFVVMPMAAVLIERSFDLDRRLEIVLIALALAPVPPMLPKKAGTLTAQSYPLALTTTMSLLSIAVAQIGVVILGQIVGRTISMSSTAMASIILKAVLAPLLMGMLVRRAIPAVADRLQKPLAIAAGVLLAAATLALLAASASALWALASPSTLVAIVAFVLIGLAAGHVLGGPEPEHASVLALASASRHPGVALALASANFPLDRFGGFILLYLVVTAIVSLPYTKWRKSTMVEAIA
jgi:BASS family bile acid:Na+ symporter